MAGYQTEAGNNLFPRVVDTGWPSPDAVGEIVSTPEAGVDDTGTVGYTRRRFRRGTPSGRPETRTAADPAARAGGNGSLALRSGSVRGSFASRLGSGPSDLPVVWTGDEPHQALLSFRGDLGPRIRCRQNRRTVSGSSHRTGWSVAGRKCPSQISRRAGSRSSAPAYSRGSDFGPVRPRPLESTRQSRLLPDLPAILSQIADEKSASEGAALSRPGSTGENFLASHPRGF